MFFKLHDPGSSFFDFLSSQNPQVIPEFRRNEAATPSPLNAVPHGTTVLALRYNNGVIVAGDRMATEGLSVSGRRMEKVLKTDEYSVIAISGAAGPAIELTKLFQTELEHYEKIEGVSLTTEGKANKLGQMIKSNLPMAFQGLVVIPIFVSYDFQKNKGRIFKYDITGGRYEETDHYSTGSGGRDARNILKARYNADLSAEDAIRIAVEALFNASEEDIGTGGPDPVRGIYPTVKLISSQGTVDAKEAQVKAAYEFLIEKRKKGVS